MKCKIVFWHCNTATRCNTLRTRSSVKHSVVLLHYNTPSHTAATRCNTVQHEELREVLHHSFSLQHTATRGAAWSAVSKFYTTTQRDMYEQSERGDRTTMSYAWAWRPFVYCCPVAHIEAVSLGVRIRSHPDYTMRCPVAGWWRMQHKNAKRLNPGLKTHFAPSLNKHHILHP